MSAGASKAVGIAAVRPVSTPGDAVYSARTYPQQSLLVDVMATGIHKGAKTLRLTSRPVTIKHPVLLRWALTAACSPPAPSFLAICIIKILFQFFLRRYARGLTPNPDLACNRAIKFDALLRHARGLGAESLVTGHFARLRHLPGACEWLKWARMARAAKLPPGPDPACNQSVHAGRTRACSVVEHNRCLIRCLCCGVLQAAPRSCCRARTR